MSLLVITRLLVIFLIGLFQDALSALYLRYSSKVITASIISILHTALGCGVWIHLFNVMQVSEGSLGGANLLAYSLGSGLGVYLGLRLFKKKCKKVRIKIRKNLTVYRQQTAID